MEKSWRLILDGSADGFYNMAKDETLLASYRRSKIPTLRVYSWSAPCISMGYAQRATQVLHLDKCIRGSIPFVRRITGGAAILHSDELTYSLVCSIDDLSLPKQVKASFWALNSFLLDFYRRLGIDVAFAQDRGVSELGRYGTFCFSSSEYFDIVVGGKKVGGNAQRRLHSVIFQQGSIPIHLQYDSISQCIKDVDHDIREKTTCLSGLLTEEITIKALQEIFVDSFCDTFGVAFNKSDLDREEQRLLENLFLGKYRSNAWNFRNEESIVA